MNIKDLIAIILGCMACFIEGYAIAQISNINKFTEIHDKAEEVKKEMCDKYCRYPYTWNEVEELYDSDICKNCPLSEV